MKPGRDLDKLIGVKVMGIEPWPGKPGSFTAYYVPNGKPKVPCLPPEYSTDIAAAWKVVEKLRHLHPHINYNDTETIWRVEFVNCDEETISHAETAPHAICLAALKSINYDFN